MDHKALLKEAKEAIKNREFQKALKLCKSIIKEDRTNYMAFVFIGLALQEIGPVDQAPKAFQKAIELNPSNPLARQGLISFYEKSSKQDTKLELINAILSYLAVESNDTKILDYSKKLSDIAACGDVAQISRTLLEVSKKCSEKSQQEIFKIVNNILESIPDDKKPLDVVEECLQETIRASCVTENSYSNYLTLLNKTGDSLRLLKQSEQMAELFPSSSTALSWICKIYNQLHIEGNMEFECSNISTYVRKLLEIDPKNAMGLFTEALLQFCSSKFVAAREKLMDVTSQRPGLLYAWVLLTDVQLKLDLIQEAAVSLNKSQRLIHSLNNPGQIFEKICLQELEVLSLSNSKDDLMKCLDMCNQKNIDNTQVLVHAITACIKLERYIEAENYISQLQVKAEGLASLHKLRFYRKQGKFSEAQKIINHSSNNSLWWWLEIGQVYWDMQEYHKALEPFLKAAKCDSDHYVPFIYLGRYYATVSQIDKARRCYEKAFKLNSLSSEAGSALSKIYRKQKNWDSNLSLLVNLTQSSPNVSNIWAWLQLGLTYLEQGNAVTALEYLRIVIRIQPENVHCWESLADAYFSNGAYMSALKCYQKALNLAEFSLYSALQVACIKKILGEFAEAQADFENILIRNNSYVPALKGLGETYLCRARECYNDQRIGTARDYAQNAANKLTLAIFQRSELTSLWKLLADSLHFVAKLPEKYSFLKISRSFTSGNKSDESALLEQEELFELAIKFYCKTVSLAQDNPFFWHDLSTCYLDYARTKTPQERSQFLEKALSTAQQCTSLNPEFWQHWNLLGNVALISDPPNYALAQHSFIKAVVAENNSAVAWTNLGILYLLMGDLKLANKAFSEGQRSDPNYVNCWIGQGLIAETMGHSDAMDLFRHSTQLGQHQQGSIGYGHWVCHMLLNSSPDDKAVKYNIYNMHAIPVAFDTISWYTEKNQDDSCSWNILGILSERLGLLNSSKNAFKHAFVLADKKNKDLARVNYGRLLYRTGEYKAAIEMFDNVEAATFSSGGGLALALFRDAQYEESYSAYEQALHWLTEEQANQSELLVALASMAYKFQGPDAAKTILFQSIGLEQPSPWSLYATFALSLLHNDMKLCQLVLKELTSLESRLVQKSINDHQEFIFHYCTLLSCLFLLTEDKKGGVCGLSRLIHKYPNIASTWLILSQLLLRLEDGDRKLKAGVRCAGSSLKLGNSHTDVCTALCTVTLSFQRAGDIKQATIFAQKIAHYRPDLPNGWALLISLLSGSKSDFATKLLDYLRRTKCCENILQWSHKVGGVSQ